MSENDDEIESINRKKLEEIMTRKRMQQAQPMQSPDGKPIMLTDSNFISEISKHDLNGRGFLGSLVRSLQNGFARYRAAC